MEKELVLGIDYGGKYTGLAVVDQRNNQVLYARTVKMRDDVADILEKRREQRGIRRTQNTRKKRLRELDTYLKSIGFDRNSTETGKKIYAFAHKRGYDYVSQEEIEAMDEQERKEFEETKKDSRLRDEVLKDVYEVMSNGRATEEHIRKVEKIFNKQYRPKRFNNRIITKCKVEGCDKNTPLRKNVRDLLIENIVRSFPIQSEAKNLIKSALLESRKEDVNALFKRYKINTHIREQLRDIAYNEKLPGRTVFCKKHIPEHTEHTKEERKVFRIAPSLRTKIENVIKVINEDICPSYKFGKVVMESNNFDIEVKSQGKSKISDATNEPNDNQEAEIIDRGNKKTRFEKLIEETGGKCIYCGTSIGTHNAEEDHIYPKSKGGLTILANLVASCKKCNGDKKGRTPLESGLLPLPEIVEYIKKNIKPVIRYRYIRGKKRKIILRNDLKLKILEDTKNMNMLDFSKYMSHASIGWRYMRDRLRELTKDKNLLIARVHGYQTAHFRKWWPKFKKERGNDKHHALDAVVLASTWGTINEGDVDPSLKPVLSNGQEFDPEKHVLLKTREFERDKSRRGSLYDSMPLSINNENRIVRKWPVTEIKRGDEITVVSPGYREKLRKAFEQVNKPIGKCLDNDEAREAGFYLRENGERAMSLKCYEDYKVNEEGKKVNLGAGREQLIIIKNNVYKSNLHNKCIKICLNEKGKKVASIEKNPRLKKYFIEKEKDCKGKVLYRLYRRDYVKYEGEDTIYQITKLQPSPALRVIVKSSTEKLRKSASATKLTKVSKPKSENQIF